MPNENVIEVTISIPLDAGPAPDAREQQRIVHDVEKAVKGAFPNARYDWHDLRVPKAVA